MILPRYASRVSSFGSARLLAAPLVAILLVSFASSAAAQSEAKPGKAEIKAGQTPASRPAEKKVKRPEKLRRGGYLGLFLNEKMVDGKRHIMIESVMKGTDAEKLGFKAGDRILGVNGRRVQTGDSFIRQLWMSAPSLREMMRRRAKANPGRQAKMPKEKPSMIAINAC